MRWTPDHELGPSRYRAGLLAAATLFLIAWALPSVRASVPFAEIVIRGPEATLVALATVNGANPSWVIVVSVASALTNLVFVIAFVVGWRLGASAFDPTSGPNAPVARTRLRRLGWLLAACAALDTWWFWLSLLDDEWRILRAGYYAWVASFVLLAAAIARPGRHVRRATGRLPASRRAAAVGDRM